MFWILWILSIAMSFFIGRRIVKIAAWEFSGELGMTISFLIIGIIPFVNVILYLIALAILWWDEADISEEDIVRKIFRVKEDEKE